MFRNDARRKNLPWILPGLLLLLAFLWMVTRPAAAQEVEEPPTGSAQPLFVAANVAADQGVLDAPEVIRGRYVTLNLDAIRPVADQPPAERIVLNLFDSESWLAVKKRVESNASGSYTWIGHIPGIEGSSVILVIRDDVITGKVALNHAVYTIDTTGNGIHAVAQIDPRILDDETQVDTIVPELVENADPFPSEDVSAVLVASDDGSVIDVLVVYTDDARVAASGTAAIESKIELGVAETNQAYEQSGASQRIYLAHMEEVTHTEGTNQADLIALANPSDGILDNVHTLRNTYHADFVAMLVDTSGCGIGYLQTTAGGSPNFENLAFSVTDESCVSPNYTFAHELGHNMGLRHDWFVDANTTPYNYAHGYADRSEDWRTIMAYNNVCTGGGGSGACTRLLYFSNPNNTYLGNPMGVSGGATNCSTGSYAPDPETCNADNTSVLNSTRVNNSQFRISQITWTGSNGTDWNDPANWVIVQGPANRTSGPSSTNVNRVPLAIDDVVIPNGLTNYPVINGTFNARNVTIENGGSLTMNGGTLNVYGDWDEQGTGVFSGAAGTVIFQGILPQSITQNGGSSFNDVQIGDGTATIEVSLSSNVDINGNLTIKAGSTLSGGSQTINLVGNWDDEGNGFAPGTSNVVFDGATQTADKVTTSTIVNEPFDDAENQGCCSSGDLPAGWIREQASGSGFLGGDFTGTGEAIRFNNSPDAWLHTTSVDLIPGITYQISYDYRQLFNGATDVFTLYIGSTPASGSMSTQISTSGNFSTVVYTNQSDTFTVGSGGTYYIGIRGQQVSGAGYAAIDNIILTGTQNLTFYDLQVGSSGSTTFNQDVVVQNNLTTNSGGMANFADKGVSVEGTVINNGTLQAVKDAPASTNTTFLMITDAAATNTKFRGAEINPALNMGSTTVQIRGNQDCTSNPADPLMQRCFNITPTSAQSATIRYWFTEAERNGQDASTATVWHYDGGTSWSQGSSTSSYNHSETDATCDSVDGNQCWVEAVAVTNYSPFGVGSGLAPTLVTLSQHGAAPTNGSTIIVLMGLLLLAFSGVILWRRRA
ncbi:MAG: M12 family metallo-peptidase [Ardenticatenaceae bacterium]|nr:M12 family metallo-peptidase [Ardenticatenaceae bacterium]